MPFLPKRYLMPQRRQLNTSLGDALQAALRHTQTESTASFRVDALIENEAEATSRSAALDRLHTALSNARRTIHDSGAHLVTLAIGAGRKGMAANPRDGEHQIVLSTIKKIGQQLLNSASGHGSTSDSVLALACLAYSSEARNVVEEIIVSAADMLPVHFMKSVAVDPYQARLLKRQIDINRIAARIHDKQHALAEQKRRDTDAEAARRQAAEERRRIEIRSLNDTIRQFTEQLLFSRDLTASVPPTLSQADLRLVLHWAPKKPRQTDQLDTSVARASLGDVEFTKLCSARYAELVASEYLRSLGMTVHDVSLTQLETGKEDWRTHDLLADGLPVDVKNARQSFSDPSRYSEYLIPRFKETRISGDAVTILGVLSHYLTADQLEKGARAQCMVLGVVSQQDLDALAVWLNQMFGEVLSVAPLISGKRLPGWCFEYHDLHLPKRPEAIESIVKLLGDPQVGIIDSDEIRIPRTLGSFVSDERVITKLLVRYGLSKEHYDENMRLWRHLSFINSSVGFSRRILFAFVIGYTLLQVHKGVTGWTPDLIGDWLFLSKSFEHRRRPLGLDDPLAYVAGAVDAMTTLWSTSREQLRNFRAFRLINPWILVGTDTADTEWTLMAYCGGWILKDDGSPLAKCGLSPLVLGMDRSCRLCHRLICRACGFCSDRCQRT